jgi:hypothetical protein
MANPNIVSVSSIYGKSSLIALSTTNATSVVSNAASSGKLYKVNTLVVSNNDPSTSYGVTINIYSAAALGGTAYPWVTTVTVPPGAALVIIDKSANFYLEEDKSIGATATAANKITVIASWEEIS